VAVAAPQATRFHLGFLAEAGDPVAEAVQAQAVPEPPTRDTLEEPAPKVAAQTAVVVVAPERLGKLAYKPRLPAQAGLVFRRQ
jgi:hypothetical protein